jgi:succinate dehydrogenase/fumarate reductase flavoprotein subunit
MENYGPSTKDLASRGVFSEETTVEILEEREIGPKLDHIYFKLDHLPIGVLYERLAGIIETSQILKMWI